MMRQWMMALAIAVMVAGCAASPEPFEYHDSRDEKPGPGLFSGDRGGVVVYGESSKQVEEKEETEAPSPK